jgi:hypothetical protein
VRSPVIPGRAIPTSGTQFDTPYLGARASLESRALAGKSGVGETQPALGCAHRFDHIAGSIPEARVPEVRIRDPIQTQPAKWLERSRNEVSR